MFPHRSSPPRSILVDSSVDWIPSGEKVIHPRSLQFAKPTEGMKIIPHSHDDTFTIYIYIMYIDQCKMFFPYPYRPYYTELINFRAINQAYQSS